MIDARGRKYFDPLFSKLADQLIAWKFKPMQVTSLALLLGFLAGLLLYFEYFFPAFLLLWCSGLFDVLDGQIARKLGCASLWGAVLDIVSDRIVELAIIWAFALRREDSLLALLFLTSSILMSMTVFLTTGMATEKLKQSGNTPANQVSRHRRGVQKSFYYQAGLMERTEGFIAFSLMMLFPSQLTLFTWIYAALIGFTIGQRQLDAWQLLHPGKL